MNHNRHFSLIDPFASCTNTSLIAFILLTLVLFANHRQVQAEIVVTSRRSQAVIDVWASPPLDRYRVVSSTNDLTGTFVVNETYAAIADNANAAGDLDLLESVTTTGNQLTISSQLCMQGDSMWVDTSRANASMSYSMSMAFQVTGQPVDFTMIGTFDEVSPTDDLIRLRGGVDIFRIDESGAFKISGTLAPGTYTLLSAFSGIENTNGPGFLGGNNFVLTIGNAPVAPTSFLVSLGRSTSGGVAELAESDDQYLIIDPEFLSFRYQLKFTVDATATSESPSAMEFNYESRTQNLFGTVEQQIEFFNYDSGQFETVDSRLTTSTDTVVTVTPSGDPSRFVELGTNAMQARISYQNSLPFWVFNTRNRFLPYRVRADHIFWSIAP